jgi:hypothetical protein
MRSYKSWLVSIPLLLFTGAVGWADSLTVQVTGVGPSDGSHYVLPYLLNIGGFDAAGICYDFFDEISINQTWQANLLTLDAAQNGGQFSGVNNALVGYEEVAWLASNWFTQSLTAGDQVDLQHAIWDVFDPGAITLPDDPFLTTLLANESTGINGFDYSRYRFLEAVPANGTLAQSFVLYVPGSGQNPSDTPEPGTVTVVAIGLVLIGVSRMKLLARTRRANARF